MPFLMRKILSWAILSLLASPFFSLSPTFGADVYYNGAPVEDRPSDTKNPSFSMNQRLRDLFDFPSYGSYPAGRSGRISGSIAFDTQFENVTGQASNSFLKNGGTSLAELNLSVQERLWSSYNLESSFFLRKTDNSRFEPASGVQLKQFQMRVANEANRFEFGDLYADLSQFVLGSSVQGLHFESLPAEAQRYRVIAARKIRSETASELFAPDVFAAQGDWSLFRDSRLFSAFRLSAQAVTSNGSDAFFPGIDARNTVAGIQGECSFRNNASLAFETARSDYRLGADSATTAGLAFRIRPSYRFGRTGVQYLYYYVQPEFQSALGSAQPDRIEHRVNVGHSFSNAVAVFAAGSYAWDRLDGSTKLKRTVTDEKSVAFSLRPLARRPAFSLRPSFLYLVRDSDDASNAADAVTATAGLSVNDTLSPQTSGRLSYEYRAFDDKSNAANSERAHRFGVGLSGRHLLFSRPLAYSVEPSASFRTLDSGARDTAYGLSMNGDYEIVGSLHARFGYTTYDADNAAPSNDVLSNYGFFSLEFLVNDARSTRVMLGTEMRNTGDRTNPAQGYGESKSTVRFVSNF